MRQTAIPYMQLRGGSSKGVYFQNTDLPADHDVRSAVTKNNKTVKEAQNEKDVV